MTEKRTRISLAQKLDIIEASKKSGFSIEYVMKKYGLKKFSYLKPFKCSQCEQKVG